MFGSVQKVVCRTSNRVFVSLPLCEGPRDLPSLSFLTLIVLGRDPDWIDLNIQYTLDVFRGAAIIRLFPDSLKP